MGRRKPKVYSTQNPMGAASPKASHANPEFRMEPDLAESVSGGSERDGSPTATGAYNVEPANSDPPPGTVFWRDTISRSNRDAAREEKKRDREHEMMVLRQQNTSLTTIFEHERIINAQKTEDKLRIRSQKDRAKAEHRIADLECTMKIIEKEKELLKADGDREQRIIKAKKDAKQELMYNKAEIIHDQWWDIFRLGLACAFCATCLWIFYSVVSTYFIVR